MVELPREVVRRQDGVITRAQLLESGLSENDVRRLLRRRDLVRHHPAVYLTHTGAPTRRQREWAAVLALAPAALWGPSALRATDDVAADDHLIHLAIDRHRAVGAPSGVRLHRVVGLGHRVLWNASPPRMRVEEAALDVAASAADLAVAVAVLADVVGTRRTTAERLGAAMATRGRVRDRRQLMSILDDIEHGALSVLEREYLNRVERAHGLPRGRRQFRDHAAGRATYRDVEYEAQRLVVELDGATHRNRRQHDLDLDRDLAGAMTGRLTVRLGWGQVATRPCATAARVGLLLEARGWAGSLRRCRSCPGS